MARPFDRMVLLRSEPSWDAEKAGIILSDHRERAEAAVRDAFASDVALVDGVPMARMRRPVDTKSICDWTLVRYPGAPSTVPGAGDQMLYRIDRAPVAIVDAPFGHPERTDWYSWVPGGLRYRGDCPSAGTRSPWRGRRPMPAPRTDGG